MSRVKKYKSEIPTLTTEQMVEVDRLMIEEYHIDLIQMLENAGRCLAILAVDKFLKKNLNQKKVIVLAGTGGNGGGALVCARRLFNWGVDVSVFLSGDAMGSIPLHQLLILKSMDIPCCDGVSLDGNLEADLIIDGIIGYSIKGDPIGKAKRMITWANTRPIFKLSLDTPSGLDLTTGKIHNPTINANATMTLALPKIGLFKEDALKVRGDLYLGDISVPAELYAADSLGVNVPKGLFAHADVLKIDKDQFGKSEFITKPIAKKKFKLNGKINDKVL